ncbi:MAG: hypothetical protein M0027_18780, partial [Candidatus Dormibacteraeota bacterium]|nr:hypothetical protein [Candidatus Dormibacteraeota bacterium]
MPGSRRRPPEGDADPLARGIVEAARLAVSAQAMARPQEPADPGGLELAGAGSAARAYAEASRSPATRRAYRAAWQAFCLWCSGRGAQTLPP